MYHYVNSIANIRGDALVGFYVKAVDPGAGNIVSIYADDSGTPIVSVSGIANAAEVDSDGNVSFWIPTGTYHLDIYATDATTFVKRVESLPMVTPNDLVTATGLASSTGAAAVGRTGGSTVQTALDRIGTFVGYDTGAGGTVTQATSKTTNVTLNKLCGQIVTHNQALPAGSQVAFTLVNSNIAATDIVVVTFVSVPAGAHTLMDYTVRAGQPVAGQCAIGVRNDTAGSLSEAITIGFAVIKAVTA